MGEIKEYFIDTVSNYAHLKETASRYVSVLTVMALESIEGYTTDDFIKIFDALPQDALNESVTTIYESISSAGDRSEHYWKNRVEPFWKDIWPKSNNLRSQPISEFLIRIILETGDQLPAAAEFLADWLIPIDHPFHIVDAIAEKNVGEQFPSETLKMLDTIIENQDWYQPIELLACINQIGLADPALKAIPAYIRLTQYLRTKGLQ